MTIVAARARLLDLLSFRRRANAEQPNTAARPPNLRSDRLLVVLCVVAIVIGLIALTGYGLGNASITSLSAHGKPVPVVTALALIALGAGLLTLRWPGGTGLLPARYAALAVIVIAAADLLSAALSQHLQEWQGWAARGGVNVHAYPFAAFLFIALGSALLLNTTRSDLAGHVIASAVLLICAVFSFAYVLSVPSFLDPSTRVLPVAVATLAMVLISAAELLARPRGWVVPLLSRTSTGVMARILLLATFVVPFLAGALRDLINEMRWFTPAADLAVIVDVVEVFVSAAVVLGAGALVYRHQRDRLRLASIVDSSTDSIIATSSAGLIESWNAGAEQMYGYTAAEALGRSVTMLAPPERRDEARVRLEQIRRGERVDSFETVRVSKDGRRIDVLLSVSSILDEEGYPVGASSIARDITARKKDVTERMRAEEAMVKSEARYRTLVENLPQKIMLKDRNSVYVSVSEAYARDLGIEPKAVAGKTDYDFFPEELAGKYRADDARIMEAGLTEDLEEAYVEGGQRRFIHTVKTPVRDPQGNVTHILVIFWDITEKKLAEEHLRKAMAELEGLNRNVEKNEAALKEAQRVAHLGHWEWSTLTGDMAWSDEIYRIIGIPIGSVPPSYEFFSGLVDPPDRRRLEEELALAMASSGGAAGSGEIDIDLKMTRPAGAAMVVSERIFVDRDVAGNVVGFHGTCQDITDRVATEQALRHSEAELAEAQGIAHIGSWILDPESGEGRGSAEAHRIFAIDPAPVIPLHLIFDRVHEDDRARVEAAVAASIHSGTLDIEARLVTPQGIRVVHAVAKRRDSDERRLSLIGTIQDVTEQRAAEEVLRQRTESLERHSNDLERFNRLAVGRELRMIELKQQINDLSAQLGQPAPYVVPEERAAVRETS